MKKWNVVRKVLGERGSSIVELLISTMMAVIIGAACMEFYVTQHMNWLMQSEVASIQQGARVCLDEMATLLRMGGYGLDSTHPAFEVDSNMMVVYYYNDSTAGIDTTMFAISNANSEHPALVRQKNGGTQELYAEDIESLSITPLSSSVVQLQLTARAEDTDSDFIGGDGYRRRTYTTVVRLRNM